MVGHIVVGIGFGDEGKGRIVNKLANELRDCTAVRTGGGPNCGHTIRIHAKTHICSSIPANFSTGNAGFIGPKVLVSPEMLKREHDLILKTFHMSSELVVDKNCPIITPFDVIANQENSESLGATTGKGIHTTQKRMNDGVSFIFADLFAPEWHILQKLESVRRYYNNTELLENEIFAFLDASKWMIKATYDRNPTYYSNIIFEGNQGFYLDEDFGYFPNVTHASTTVKNAVSLLKKYKIRGHNLSDVKLHCVTRAYQTRHGFGPFSEETVELKPDLRETNVSNEFQGDFKVAPINLDLCEYAIKTNKRLIKEGLNIDCSTYIHVTCTEDLKTFDPSLYQPLQRCGEVQFHD